jgi:DNA (cytosine-5)-methyltransferase 1
MQYNAIDLFCGCGGMSKGLTDAGINIIAGIDIWDKAIENYRRNFHHQGIQADLTQLSPQQFDDQYNKNHDRIDIVVGSPPCQSFSIAGKRDPDDSRSGLFKEFVKYVDFYNPKLIMLENVVGILSAKTNDNKNVVDLIVEQLSKNHNCIICKLCACDFEVPQNRRRVIIFGIRKDMNKQLVIPNLVSHENQIPVQNILLPEDQVDASYLLSEKAIQGIKNKKAKSKENNNGFGAQFLNLNKPSYTIPARYWKDGYDALVKYSEIKIRRLTILELKRIQSFPDDYILIGSKRDVIMQIGNAVACRFAYHMGKYLISVLQ